MTEYTTIVASLRSRAEYLRGLITPTDITMQQSAGRGLGDAQMMSEAALYIERLERDNAQATAEVRINGLTHHETYKALTAMTADRDGEVRARLQHAHDLTAQSEHYFKTLTAITAERNAAQNRATLHAQNCEKYRAAANEVDGFTAEEWRNRYRNAVHGRDDARVAGDAEPVKDARAAEADRPANQHDVLVLRGLARHLNRVCDASKL